MNDVHTDHVFVFILINFLLYDVKISKHANVFIFPRITNSLVNVHIVTEYEWIEVVRTLSVKPNNTITQYSLIERETEKKRLQSLLTNEFHFFLLCFVSYLLFHMNIHMTRIVVCVDIHFYREKYRFVL